MATTSTAVLAQWTVADLKQTTTSVNKKDFAFLGSYNWSEVKHDDSIIIVPGLFFPIARPLSMLIPTSMGP